MNQLAPILLATDVQLTAQGMAALAVTAAVFSGLLLWRSLPVEVLFLGGLVAVTLCGVITPAAALAGFAQNAVILIAALFATAAGLRATGALDWVGSKLLGGVTTERAALWRLAGTIVPVSAFVLNTPLVAMFAPVVVDWCRQRSISPSRLLIPLSYLTILGGVCTLIGTSTTLVCNAKLSGAARAGSYPPDVAASVAELRLFEISLVGIPIAAVGIAYMLFVAPRLLPNRTDLVEQFGERRREYLVEMQVQPDCPLVGKTVEDAGLRSLPGLFLIEIDRGPQVITPVTPRDVIQAGDRMIFTGVVTTIADLERIPGLVPAADSSYEVDPAERIQRRLTEAVLSRTSPLIGRTVREANFRQRYNAAVVAVHRNGERLTNKIGNIRLEAGDTLLLQTRAEFVDAYRHNREFYLVSSVGDSSARRHDRMATALILFGLLIVWLIASSLVPESWVDGNPVTAAIFSRDVKPFAGLAVVLAMIITRCMNPADARAAVDIQVLFTIAAAIGLGTALDQSDAALWLAQCLVSGVGSIGISADWQPLVLLAVVYLLSMVFTEAITNVAVAAIMIPVAIGVAVEGGYEPRAFIMAVTLAASLSFITPIGYQTNLMVMGPGGYQPRDYAVVGLPLAALTAGTALVLIPWWWPLTG